MINLGFLKNIPPDNSNAFKFFGLPIYSLPNTQIFLIVYIAIIYRYYNLSSSKFKYLGSTNAVNHTPFSEI